MTRAALYARYSSDLQSTSSIEDQVRLCRDLADKAGDEIVEVFTDFAISGGSLHNRPGMQALLGAARTGSFSLVVAEALDRISRDQEDVAAIYKRLSHADVRLVTLAEGEISELHIGLKGTMNALYLKDLAQKTRRGQRGRIEAGHTAGGNSYGYRVVRRLFGDGNVARGEREIDPAQAAIVRRIYRDYANGQPPRAIAADLNCEGIPAPRGGAWNASTINGNRARRNGILNNELYIGRLVWNRQRFVKDPETGKRVARPNPETEWIVTEVPELRLIDDDLWAQVQARKARYASHAGNRRQSKKRLLSGLVKCASCGGNMTIARRDRYYCTTRREKGTCKATSGIAATELEDRILSALQDILVGNDELLEAFVKGFKEEVARLKRERHSNRDQLQQALAEVERSIARCLDFITSGDGAPGAVREKLTELETRKEAILRDLESEPPARVIDFHPNYADLYRRKVAEIAGLLADETTRPQAMEDIRSLVDRIEVGERSDTGRVEVTLVGALAQILDFAQPQKQSTAAECFGDGTFLLVAGAGFEPATFRL